jgi:hypothetical protein
MSDAPVPDVPAENPELLGDADEENVRSVWAFDIRIRAY